MIVQQLPPAVHAAVVRGDSGTVAVWNQGDTTVVYVVGPRGSAVVPRVTDSVLAVAGISTDNAKPLRDPPELTYGHFDAYVDYQVDRQAKEISKDLPDYPDPLRAGRVAGKATVQFIVDSAGRPVIGSFKALKSDNPLLTLAIFSWLPRVRYEPAQVNGHPVSELVQQRFGFGRPNGLGHIDAPQGSVEVSFDHDTAWLYLKTSTGTFAVHTDSVTMAAWADSAAHARPPAPHGSKKFDYFNTKLSYPEPSLNTIVAMEFVRLSDAASPYQVAGSNGSWTGGLELSAEGAQRLFALMHQSTSAMTVWRESMSTPDWAQLYFDFQVEQQAAPLPGSPAPGYPETLRTRNIQGEALLQFVVDTIGMIELSSVRVLKSTHPLFALAVYQRIPAMRFQPAQVGGRHVKEMVRQPYDFNLSRR
jgi:TonB family protein